MWGKFYRRKKVEGDRKAEGVVVLFAWFSSQERHLRPFVDLYWSLGWDCLICHVDFLTQFFPEKAAELACGVLDELIKGVKIRSLRIVLASFSAGSKGYFFRLLQFVGGKCAGPHGQGDYHLLRECISGQIYDSSPVNFSDDLNLQFVLHSSFSFLKIMNPPRMVSWMAKAFAYGLDALFLNSFEARRAEFWLALYSSAGIGPFLILCSDDDKLAPFQTVRCFAQRLQELGADVNFISWSASSHVAHYHHHRGEYKAAVNEFLTKASLNFSIKQLNRANNSKIPESVCYLHGAAVSSNESLMRVAVEPSDHFFIPSSKEQSETEPAIYEPKSINPHGVLSQILFDVCVPKSIEGWDIKLMPSLTKSCERRGPFDRIKCIRRSRL